MKKVFARILALVLLVGFPVWGADGQPVITILHTNDVHGRYAASDTAIGHDRIAALRNMMRERCPATLLLDAGDAIQGNAFLKWNTGQAAVDIMQAADYDALVPGNHELDYGWDRLAQIAASGAVPVLTQPDVALGARGFSDAALYERGGRVVGIFGITTPQTRTSSDGGKGLTFASNEDIIAAADATAAMLRFHGAEIVVCLAHLGIDSTGGALTSYMLRDAVESIDVIIDGHSHTRLDQIEQAPGRALITSTGEHGEHLGVVEFFCTPEGLAPFARLIDKAQTLDVEPDAATAAVLQKWVDADKKFADKVLTHSKQHFSAVRLEMRTRQTQLGACVADAIRWAAGSDIACINGGSIRADLPEGQITNGVVNSIFPYLNSTIRTAAVSGALVRAMLEHSVHKAPADFGGFLHVSGLTFTYDPSRPVGSRIVSVEVGGRPLDDAAEYTLTLTDWLASGGDGYDMVVDPFTPTDKTVMLDIRDVMVRYLDKHDGKAPDVDTPRIIAK